MIWYALGSIKFIFSSESLEGIPHHGIFTNFPMIFLLRFKYVILEKTKKNLVSKYFQIYLTGQLGLWYFHGIASYFMDLVCKKALYFLDNILQKNAIVTTSMIKVSG